MYGIAPPRPPYTHGFKVSLFHLHSFKFNNVDKIDFSLFYSVPVSKSCRIRFIKSFK